MATPGPIIEILNIIAAGPHTAWPCPREIVLERSNNDYSLTVVNGNEPKPENLSGFRLAAVAELAELGKALSNIIQIDGIAVARGIKLQGHTYEIYAR